MRVYAQRILLVVGVLLFAVAMTWVTDWLWPALPQ